MDIEHYHIEKGQGEPLILLHGNGENCDYYLFVSLGTELLLLFIIDKALFLKVALYLLRLLVEIAAQ